MHRTDSEKWLAEKPTGLSEEKMPRWLWQLRLKGFHTQLKKYLRFLWRQRQAGCNWSQAYRAKFFNRSTRTIRRWDKFLINNHLAWTSARYTLWHRIGARPYYEKDVWTLKKAESRAKITGVKRSTTVGH